MNIIKRIQYHFACKKLVKLNSDLLAEQRWARTDVRLSGHVYAFRVELMDNIQAEIDHIVERFHGDFDTMYQAGV